MPHRPVARRQKTLHECAHSSKTLRATPAGALACPYGMSRHQGGKKILTETLAFAGPLWISLQKIGGYCQGQPWRCPNYGGTTCCVDSRSNRAPTMKDYKSSRTKTRMRNETKDNQKALCPTVDFLKDDPLYKCRSPPFIGRRTDFLHSENTLV
jgi:hypothetical protein